MNKFRREVTIEILVGLFIFIVLIALGTFTIVLSRENLLQKSYEYEFVFPEISGLRRGDNVYLRGMNVGRVEQTDLDDGNVRVYVKLDEKLALRRGYKIEIINASMLGGKFLKINEGNRDAPLIGSNVTILGAPPVDVIQELGLAVTGLQEMINAIDKGEGTLGKLLKDETIYENLLNVSEDLKSVSARLEDGDSTIGRLLSDDSAVYEDLKAAMASIRNITESIDNGEGTLGRLTRDAELYDEATLLVEDVRAAVDDLREASPITSFGSVFFGAF